MWEKEWKAGTRETASVETSSTTWDRVVQKVWESRRAKTRSEPDIQTRASRRRALRGHVFFWTESGPRGRHRGNNPSDGENRMGGSSGTKSFGVFRAGVAVSDCRIAFARWARKQTGLYLKHAEPVETNRDASNASLNTTSRPPAVIRGICVHIDRRVRITGPVPMSTGRLRKSLSLKLLLIIIII